jgi:hypothetical protein
MSDHTDDGVQYEPVYRAANASIAEIVTALLEAEGIPVTPKSLQVAWYDGIMVAGEGYWGDLLVPKERADEARKLIEAYDNKGEPPDAEESTTDEHG